MMTQGLENEPSLSFKQNSLPTGRSENNTPSASGGDFYTVRSGELSGVADMEAQRHLMSCGDASVRLRRRALAPQNAHHEKRASAGAEALVVTGR